MPWPMPEPAPVTIAVFSLSDMRSSFLCPAEMRQQKHRQGDAFCPREPQRLCWECGNITIVRILVTASHVKPWCLSCGATVAPLPAVLALPLPEDSLTYVDSQAGASAAIY